MKTVTIDCRLIPNRIEFHNTLRQTLSLPEWYGNNLDALHDCLSQMQLHLEFIGWDSLQDSMGHYSTVAKRAILDACAENATLTVEFLP